MADLEARIEPSAVVANLEARIERIELFLQGFCALQLIHQGLLECSEEEKKALEFLVATTLEEWKNSLR